MRRPVSPQILTVTHIDPEKQKIASQNGHNKRTEEAMKKWKVIARMANEGKTNRQIAYAVGFTEYSVAERIKKLRKMGWDIPDRKSGRKAGEAWQGKKQQS